MDNSFLQQYSTVGEYEVTVCFPPVLPLPLLSSFHVRLRLTSADTDQVVSSQLVSMEPSNRKQVRPDTQTLMLNVAV